MRTCYIPPCRPLVFFSWMKMFDMKMSIFPSLSSIISISTLTFSLCQGIGLPMDVTPVVFLKASGVGAGVGVRGSERDNVLPLHLIWKYLCQAPPVQLTGLSLRENVTSILTTLSSGMRQENTVCLRRSWYYLIVCSIYNSILQADLASIHSEEENDFLREITGNTHKVWLGGRRCCPGCQAFEWSDGTPWDFNAWQGHQPDNYVSCMFLDFSLINYVIVIQRVTMRPAWK